MATESATFHQGYLTVTPLDKVFASGKRRFVTLSRSDPFQQSSIELNFYSDHHLSEKKGQMSLANVTKIHGNFGKSKERAFAVETKARKLVFKAEEESERNIWVAKLFELCMSDHSTHVSIPSQPCASYNEGLLKLSHPTSIHVICPSSHSTLIEIPFKDVRRFGYELIFDTDMMWFETCRCKLKQTNFVFFTVGSGTERALALLYEIKSKIESSTGTLLIQEKSSNGNISYIARSHYGCDAFPASSRDRLVQVGIFDLPRGWGGQLARMHRRQSEHQTQVTEDSAGGRLHAASPLPEAMSPHTRSPIPSPSPYSSPHSSPTHSPTAPHKVTLDQVRGNRGILKHAATLEVHDSGIPQEQFDPSRFSAPSRLSPGVRPPLVHQGSSSAGKVFPPHASSERKPGLSDLRQGSLQLSTFEERRRRESGEKLMAFAERTRRVSGERMAISLDGRSSSTSAGGSGRQGMTLDRLYTKMTGSEGKKAALFGSKDSALDDDEYDHLGGNTAATYDHLKASPTATHKKNKHSVKAC